MFAPSAVVRKEEEKEWEKISKQVLKVRIRNRLTWDGGTSAVCLNV
jgi:hypothetical protein